MNSEFFDALDLLEKEKGVKKSYMLEKVHAALTSAFRRDFGSDNVLIVLDDEKKEVKMYASKEVVEEVENPVTQISLADAKLISAKYGIGDTVQIEIKPKNFGRIATGAAKQVIIQGIREAERNIVYDQFANKEHQILTAVVNKIDPKPGNATVELAKTETVLLKSEQIPGEVLHENQRIKVYVIEVKRAAKGPVVSVSRTHPGLVKHLFELEVPEIYEGIVEIKSISREAGSRTKIAVYSNDENVDPIGTCVGPKGARVANIVDELCGEKIDIIKYSENPDEYVASALAPAKVLSVGVDNDAKSCQVIVPDDQLSLAIGKEGQNARLAAKLTGWKIDIKPLSTIREKYKDELTF